MSHCMSSGCDVLSEDPDPHSRVGLAAAKTEKETLSHDRRSAARHAHVPLEPAAAAHRIAFTCGVFYNVKSRDFTRTSRF